MLRPLEMSMLKFKIALLLVVSATYFFFPFEKHKIDENELRFMKKKSKGTINACILIIVRNIDYTTMNEMIKILDTNFNHKYHYPYVILQNEPINKHLAKIIAKDTESSVEFGTIAEVQWSMPNWIDVKKLNASLNNTLPDVFRGLDWNYHHLNRFLSGFFFRHKLTLKYDYYMRVDVHSLMSCPFEEDPIARLVKEKKKFGFVSTTSFRDLYDQTAPIESLWSTVRKWPQAKTKIEDIENFMFCSNFEVGDFSLYRDPDYINYFEYLDKSGGFYWELWNDAAVRSYYMIVKLNLKNTVYQFQNIVFGHLTFFHMAGNFTKRDNCDPKKFVKRWPSFEGKLNELMSSSSGK